MAEKIGLEAFVDTSKFKPGFAEYVSGMDKMVFGTERLSDTMDDAAKPSVNLANKIADLGNRVLLQQRQVALYQQELAKLSERYGASSAQAQKKQLQIDRLTVSIDKNTRTLGTYRQQVEASQKDLNQFEQEAKETNKALSLLDVTVGSFAGTTLSGAFQSAVSTGFGLLVDLGKAALDAVGSHEKLTLAIETLTARELINSGQAGSMGEAMQQASGRSQELLGWIEELAVKSPFTSEDIASTFKMAQAYGFTSAEAQRLTQTLTDFTAGAGLSADVGNHIALALGQIQAKGKVSAQELNQLRETGLNVNAVLEGMGFNLSDVEKGLVRADGFIAAVVQTLERDFEGAAARQTESWQGLISTLEDTKKIALREFFQGTFDAIQPLVADFVGVLSSEEFKTSLRESGEALGELVAQGVSLTKETDWNVIARALGSAKDSAEALEPIFNPKEALETAARGFLLMQGGLVALNELAKEPGGFVDFLYGTGDAAREAKVEILGLAKEAEQLVRLQEGAQRQRSGVAKGGSATEETFGVSTELTSADVERRESAMEKLGEATRDYNEKLSDFNQQAIEASQDYADKQRELQNDLASEQQELNQARRDAAMELSDGLIEAESEYNQAAIEISQERADAASELNASRLEAEQEFNTERAELEAGFNQAAIEIGQQRLEAESELNAGRAEAQAEALASLAELEREHSEEVLDINRSSAREIEDFNRERLRAEEEFKLKRDELEQDHAQKVKDFAKDIEEATSDTAEKRLDIETDLQEKLSDLEEKRKDKLSDIQDDIDDILDRRKVKVGLGSEDSLSKEDKKRLDDLREQLAEETEEFSKQQADIEEKAKEALAKETERSDESLANLKDKLAQEDQAYTDSIAEQDRKYAQQEEDRNLAHNRAVEDLTLRLERENAEFDRQRGDIQNKLNDRLGDLQASYDEAVGKLDQRLATERAKLDEQRAALQAKYQEELSDIQQKHDEAVGKLDARLAEERSKLAEQRLALQESYREEVADVEASYAERVATIQEKLRDIAVANAEKQLELREQMKETRDDFAEKAKEIGEAWSVDAMDKTKVYAEYLAKLQNYLSQTKFPVNFEINLPEFLIPGSPSPLELSLMRTKGLLTELNTMSVGPALSPAMTSSPAMLSPSMSVGGASFFNSFGDVVVGGGMGSPQEVRDTSRQAGLSVESDLASRLMSAAQRQRGNYRSDFGERT